MAQQGLIPGANITEWAGIDTEDSGIDDVQPSFPQVKLVQAVSKMVDSGKHGGDFWRSDTEEYLPSLTLVPIYRRITRAYFEEASEKPDCSSSDGVYPNDYVTLWAERNERMPSSCNDCPLSAWGEDGVPPPCSESWVFLCDLGGELVQLRIRGKNIRPWKSYISRRLAPKRLPLYSHELTVKASRKTAGQNTWYEMELTPRVLTVGEGLKYQEVLRAYREQFVRHVAAEDINAAPADEEWTE